MVDSGIKSRDYALKDGVARNGVAVAKDVPQPDDLGHVTEKDLAQAQALQAKLHGNENAGARVMTFDENATPEQKAAQAKAAKNKVKPKGQVAAKQAEQPSGMGK